MLVRIIKECEIMELLAPAGDMKQAITCIENGCNAIYGGLKKWGARTKCSNFTFCEYNELISLCRKNNIKFYLTINALLLDDEIKEILSLFKSKKILLPDAVIVADIGLIICLRKNFPELPIHVSTQFGAYNINDIKFLESLGVTRVVLARELSITEIENICKNTSIEIEVFVYGSQCIAFSGQCLFGGILNKTSGNRGRCNSYCRRLFSCNNQIGEFFYQRDLYSLGTVEKLKKIGVHSIKIEGRYRKSEEIAEVVQNFRKSIDFNLFDNSFNGYLDPNTDFSSMFTAISPTYHTCKSPSTFLNEHDLVVTSDKNNNNVKFFSQDMTGTMFSYWKSLLYNYSEYPNNNTNLSIEYFNKDSMLIIKSRGGKKTIYKFNNCDKFLSVYQLYECISSKTNELNIEFISDVPVQTIINISSNTLNKIISEIKNISASQHQINNNTTIEFENIVYISKSIDDILRYQDNHNEEAIYQITTIEDLSKALLKFGDSKSIIYEIPILDFSNKLNIILKMLTGKRIIVNSFSQLNLTTNYKYSEIFANYTLNLWNTESVKYIKKYGVSGIIVHPEVEYTYFSNICNKLNIKSCVFGYTHLVTGYTRTCFSWLKICSRKCSNSSIIMKDILSNRTIYILCDNEFGYRKLLPSCIFITKQKLNNTKAIVDYSYFSQDYDELVEIYNDNVE